MKRGAFGCMDLGFFLLYFIQSSVFTFFVLRRRIFIHLFISVCFFCMFFTFISVVEELGSYLNLITTEVAQSMSELAYFLPLSKLIAYWNEFYLIFLVTISFQFFRKLIV